jgi:hypothetical protein
MVSATRSSGGALRGEAVGSNELAALDCVREIAVVSRRLTLGEGERHRQSAERLILQRVEALLDRLGCDLVAAAGLSTASSWSPLVAN